MDIKDLSKGAKAGNTAKEGEGRHSGKHGETGGRRPGVGGTAILSEGHRGNTEGRAPRQYRGKGTAAIQREGHRGEQHGETLGRAPE